MKLWQQIETGADLAAAIPSRPIQGRFDCLAKSPRMNHQSFFTYTRTIAIALDAQRCWRSRAHNVYAGSGAASAVLRTAALRGLFKRRSSIFPTRQKAGEVMPAFIVTHFRAVPTDDRKRVVISLRMSDGTEHHYGVDFGEADLLGRKICEAARFVARQSKPLVLVPIFAGMNGMAESAPN
jgi:hypothetical protein